MKSIASYAGGARAELADADVVLFRGKGLSSLLIRWVTRSAYSHVGLIFRQRGRVLCAQATGSGVGIVLMSDLVKEYEGGIDYFRVTAADDAHRQSALDFVFGQLGRPYDYLSGLLFLRALLFGQMAKELKNRKWFCSELVAEAYRVSGLPLIERRSSDYVSPAHLAQGAQLRFAYTLKR